MISVVTPWRTLLSAFGLIGSVKSECVLMSIKPGATASPSASMIFRAASVPCAPTIAMRPPSMARSDAMPGLPAPSYKIPPRIRMSHTAVFISGVALAMLDRRGVRRRHKAWIDIAETTIAGNHMRRAFFDAAEFAIPNDVAGAEILHRAPWRVAETAGVGGANAESQSGHR